MTTQSQLSPGDAFILFAMFLWLTIAVGPWWVGVILFFTSMLINTIVYYIKNRR